VQTEQRLGALDAQVAVLGKEGFTLMQTMCWGIVRLIEKLLIA
jgi:hypothetical protein